MPVDEKNRSGECLLSQDNVWRAARLLVEVHGDDARMAAAQRVDRAAAHRPEIAQTWRDVLLAVDEIMRQRQGGELH